MHSMRSGRLILRSSHGIRREGEGQMTSDAHTLTIREAKPADLDALECLIEELGCTPGRETVAANLERLAHGPMDRTYVAETGARVMGLITVHLVPLLHDRYSTARITALVVSEAERGRGIAAALVAKAEEFAREKKCNRAEIMSRDGREGAHRFYAKLGYETNDRRFIKHFSPTSWEH